MYKVIIADDEPLILAGLRRKVDWASYGFEIVAECTDGQMLLGAITAKQPDLLVVDIQMPHKTGLEVIQAIQNIFPVLVIVISGYSDFFYAQEALRYGVVDYLLKPVAARTLQDALNKVKRQLELHTQDGKHHSDLFWHYLQKNIANLTREEILSKLSLSGARKHYWLAAFHGYAKPRQCLEQEIVVLRYNEHTQLALVHSDILPVNYEQSLKEIFGFVEDVGVAKPFMDLGELLQAADEAYMCLETRWIKHGIYLWPTKNASQSIKHYLYSAKQALLKGEAATVSALLVQLPDYVVSHRLNINSVAVIYNSLLALVPVEQEVQPVVYVTWQELCAKYTGVDDMISALHAQLVTGNEEDEASSVSKVIIFKIKMLLQKDYSQSISLQSMATRYHIDKSYLSSLFHSEVGETFTNYLTSIRIHHACEYLTTTNLSHSKIALLCGFNTDSYMKKVFRKVLGTTPSAYRQEAMQNALKKTNG